MATKDNDGNWIDATGKAVPPSYVSSQDKARDRLVEKHHKLAVRMSAQLAQLKRETMAAIDGYLEALFKKHGVKPNERGNYTLTGFSGDKQIILKMHRYMDFNESIEAAKALIDQCLDDWSADANQNLRTIVTEAFRVHGKKGLDVKSVLQLRTYKIKDKSGRWQKAMDLIGDSLYVTNAKAYVQFRSRASQDEDWKSIPLDIAAV